MARKVCKGWHGYFIPDFDGVSTCGKVFGELETADGKDSHGICPECSQHVENIMNLMESKAGQIAESKARKREVERQRKKVGISEPVG